MDESCLHCLCNKITLQPIIENAIVHGLDLMVDSGHIEITVKPDGDDILLIVADDGIGMEPEQVAALLQNEPSDRTASASRMSMTVCASTLARTTVSPLKAPPTRAQR